MLGNIAGFCLVFILLLQSQALFAQALGEEDFPVALRKRVNSIDAFINRFNNREDLLGNYKPQDSVTDAFVVERRRNILSLFDYDKFRKAEGSDKDDLIEFINLVNSIEHQLCLDFYDSNWYAVVDMDVLYHNQPKELTLIMTVEQTEPKVSKWTIRGVKADFLKVKRTSGDTIAIIPPNSHGTDFIGLPNNLTRAARTADLTSRETSIDMLSVFLYARQQGEIQFRASKRVCYYFMQIPDWVVKVREFNRKSENSGWLIEQLTRVDYQTKDTYIQQLLSIK
ncbi:hypothetical protein WBG78_14260 [Chryseolinea sp. T2]|uniref:hypothetical protein n=1 Tax=Chryseolinea sp. T2 TaxID=3129255 RepID=UPI0030770A6A